MPESFKLSIIFVTSNINKAKEIGNVLSTYDISIVVSQIKKREIQSEDIGEIARESALYAYQTLKKPLFVEDAGLFVKILNGFPGPYSSFVYKTIGVDGVLKLMFGQSNREAEFISQIAYINEEGSLKLCRGSCEGTIAEEARGCGGFGFDPIFIPKGCSKTFAEMSVVEKNMFSHRAKAARLLASMLLEEYK
ncbi:MAG: XTP/dITP diphosphatase [Nitrososphaerales archaeon]